MGRRNRRRADAPLRPLSGGLARSESWRGADWIVRSVPGQAAGKVYVCPGCVQEIRPGVPHVVTWPADGSVDERRHWHTSCWAARDRRPPRG